ncbi:uncharacterized protein TNCV_1778221 [Trichonephila clavipes]|nr:uncharacterized protein TNCV_1778221 [Trichonephila clavipes]
MDPTCQQRTVQAGGGSVMVWSVCSWCDMGPLIRLDTTLTSDRYVSILSDLLHPFMSTVLSDCACMSTVHAWETSAGQCETPHVQNCYRVAPGALF